MDKRGGYWCLTPIHVWKPGIWWRVSWEKVAVHSYIARPMAIWNLAQQYEPAITSNISKTSTWIYLHQKKHIAWMTDVDGKTDLWVLFLTCFTLGHWTRMSVAKSPTRQLSKRRSLNYNQMTIDDGLTWLLPGPWDPSKRDLAANCQVPPVIQGHWSCPHLQWTLSR